MNHPLEEVIDRREALRRAALLLGGTISAPAVLGVLAGCDASTPVGGGWTPRVLTASQAELVAAIAERIIPETDTPGARGVQVNRFIDTMLAKYYATPERDHFLDGLADVDERARHGCGNSFLRCSSEDQHALLERIDREAFASTAVPPPFFRTMKELTILGYYTSRVGATEELRHVQVPGRFEGCVPLEKNDHAFDA